MGYEAYLVPTDTDLGNWEGNNNMDDPMHFIRRLVDTNAMSYFLSCLICLPNCALEGLFLTRLKELNWRKSMDSVYHCHE